MDGYRDLTLGMTFEEAIGRVEPRLFNPVSLKECFDDLAIRGCGLTRNSADTIYEMRNGIPYALSLNFNSDDKLTDIALNFRREKGITGAQCRSIFAKTVDWVVRDYGPVTFKRSGDKLDVPGNDKDVVAKTPSGTEYRYNTPDTSGSFVVAFMHPVGEKVVRRNENGNQLVVKDQRSISLFASYIVVGDGICDVDFEIQEPYNIARPSFLEN